MSERLVCLENAVADLQNQNQGLKDEILALREENDGLRRMDASRKLEHIL